VGRFASSGNSPPVVTPTKRMPGGGILIGLSAPAASLTGLPAELKKLADENRLPIASALAAPPHISSYSKPSALPERFAQLGIATLFPRTPGETMSPNDAGR